MKLDELKPLWKSYKEQTGEHHNWSAHDIEQLLKTAQPAIPWYGRSSGILKYACILLLFTLTGC